MSISGLFNIGTSALLASQTALAVTSNNIANVSTPGYSKQAVTLAISTPVGTAQGALGTGVTVAGINRSYDQFVEAQLIGQQQNQGRSAALDLTLGQVEPVFNEAQGVGLSTALSDFFNAWQDVSTNPTSQSGRLVLIQKGDALSATAKQIENGLTNAVNGANSGIKTAVGQINTLATDIAALNDEIIRQEAGSTLNTANELRDQRQQKLGVLAGLVDFSSYEDQNGAVNITIGMRTIVSGTQASQIATKTNADGNPDLYLDGINITSTVQKGQLGGLIAARDQIQTNIQPGFRKLIASITQQINMQHEAGFGLDGSTGNSFFSPLQQLTTTQNSAGATIAASITNPALLTLDEYKITFDAGGNYAVYKKNDSSVPPVAVAAGVYSSGAPIALPGMSVTITGAVTPADTFTVSPLAKAVSNFSVVATDPKKIAAAAAATQLPGDNSNAILIAQLGHTAQTAIGNTTFSGYYNGIVSLVGTQKQTSADSLTFDTNLLTAFQTRRDSISGVSLDEEAANLLRFQRSYEAGARLITVTDQLMQTVLNL